MNRYWRRVGGLFLVLILIGLLLPSHARIERATAIDAHPATVFALLNDSRQVNKWAPVTEDDPNARLDFSGPFSGVGATMTWHGQIIGRGRQTIVESEPYERIVSEVEADNGRRSTNLLSLDAEDGGTRVSWIYERDYGLNLAGRFFALFLDGIVGPELDERLAALAQMAERLPRADFSDLEVERIVVPATDIAWLRTTSLPEAGAVSDAMSDSFFEILNFIDAHATSCAGSST